VTPTMLRQHYAARGFQRGILNGYHISFYSHEHSADLAARNIALLSCVSAWSALRTMGVREDSTEDLDRYHYGGVTAIMITTVPHSKFVDVLVLVLLKWDV